MTASRHIVRRCVCGVDCHPGDERCNGYCRGEASEPPTYEVAQYDFSEALRLLKAGRQLARLGWNGHGQSVKHVAADGFYNAHFVIKTVNGTVAVWTPSVSDCLADDWVLLS